MPPKTKKKENARCQRKPPKFKKTSHQNVSKAMTYNTQGQEDQQVTPQGRVTGKYHTCSTGFVIVIYCYRSIPGSYKQGRHKWDDLLRRLRPKSCPPIGMQEQVSCPCQVLVTP